MRVKQPRFCRRETMKKQETLIHRAVRAGLKVGLGALFPMASLPPLPAVPISVPFTAVCSIISPITWLGLQLETIQPHNGRYHPWRGSQQLFQCPQLQLCCRSGDNRRSAISLLISLKVRAEHGAPRSCKQNEKRMMTAGGRGGQVAQPACWEGQGLI